MYDGGNDVLGAEMLCPQREGFILGDNHTGMTGIVKMVARKSIEFLMNIQLPKNPMLKSIEMLI